MGWVPERFLPLRAAQERAVEEITGAWADGAKVVIWQAPTGTGKTIGAVAAAEQAKVDRLLYTCVGKQLQDQFARDFPDAKVLKGRANYSTLTGIATAAECNKMGSGADAVCAFCEPTRLCPYQVAKEAAIRGPLSVVNTAYLLAEANGVRNAAFSGWPMAVIDEADEMEAELMRYLEFRVGPRVASRLRVTIPKKATRRPGLVEFLGQVSEGAGREALGYARNDPQQAKERKRWERLSGQAARMGRLLDDEWVRVYDDREGAFVLKPVTVHQYGQQMIWRHAERWLVMSATILSGESWAESLGLAADEWRWVESPSDFPVRNRPVFVTGVAAMTHDRMDESEPKMVEAVAAIVDRHEGENVLVHTHTYRLAEALARKVRPADGRKVMTYTAKDREQVVERFRSDGGVLLAPSLARGVDLPDDLCRVVIIAKIPFPYLGDPQISRRLHMPGGQVWYTARTVREVVQMTGRGVRHREDWAVTYVLDGQFAKNVWGRGGKALFPMWWRDAVQMVPARRVLEGVEWEPPRAARPKPRPPRSKPRGKLLTS